MDKKFKEIYNKLLIDNKENIDINILLETLDEVLINGKTKTIEFNGIHFITIKRNEKNCIEIYTKKDKKPIIIFDNKNKCDLINLGKFYSLIEYIKIKGIEKSFDEKYNTLITNNEGTEKLIEIIKFVENTGLLVNFYIDSSLYTINLNDQKGINIITQDFKKGTEPYISFDEDKIITTEDFLNLIELSNKILKYGIKST